MVMLSWCQEPPCTLGTRSFRLASLDATRFGEESRIASMWMPDLCYALPLSLTGEPHATPSAALLQASSPVFGSRRSVSSFVHRRKYCFVAPLEGPNTARDGAV